MDILIWLTEFFMDSVLVVLGIYGSLFTVLMVLWYWIYKGEQDAKH